MIANAPATAPDELFVNRQPRTSALLSSLTLSPPPLLLELLTKRHSVIVVLQSRKQ